MKAISFTLQESGKPKQNNILFNLKERCPSLRKEYKNV